MGLSTSAPASSLRPSGSQASLGSGDGGGTPAPAARRGSGEALDSEDDEAPSPRRCAYWLPPGSVFGSWNLRAAPSFDGAVVGVVAEGDAFDARPLAGDGAWLEVVRDDGETAYASRRAKGEARARLVPRHRALRLRPREEERPPPAGASDGDGDCAFVRALLERRRGDVEAAAVGSDARVRASHALETTRAQLVGVAGFSHAQIDGVLAGDGPLGAPGAPAGVQGAGSFRHRGFSNAKARTCWLSSLAQVLWHSTVFHEAFDAALFAAGAPGDGAGGGDAPPTPARKISALAKTWASFGAASDGALSPDDLARAFRDVADARTGYGDASEAYCSLQNAFDSCAGPSLRPFADLGKLLKYAPVLPSPTLPDLGVLWREHRQVFDLDGGAVVAFDLSWHPLDPASTRALALACGGKLDGGGAGGDESADAPKILADAGYRLAGLISYHHQTRHYICFVRCRSDHSYLYFNDLHYDESHQRHPFDRVAAMCGACYLQPRLVVYENPAHADYAAFLGANARPVDDRPDPPAGLI